MHFALPRKSSSPPPYARASARATANQRRQRLQYLSYTVLCVLTIYLLYGWLGPVSGSTNSDHATIPKDSTVLIVTVLDEEKMSKDYISMIKANRDHYAARHGYETFYTNTSTYKNLYDPSPASWALVPALRNALTSNPETDYIWSLTADALIMNFTLSLHEHVFSALPTLMLKDIPIVPPDSVIRTFSHLDPSSANLIITQDYDNLAHTSFLLRNTLTIPQSPGKPKDIWTQFFLDAWFDPLYREYAFQKAENHALEHIVQWHPTLLAKIVLVKQRQLCSYNFQYPTGRNNGDRVPVDSMWRDGDLIVNFKGCTDSDQRDCEHEMRDYFGKWMGLARQVDGKTLEVSLETPMRQYRPNGRGTV